MRDPGYLDRRLVGGFYPVPLFRDNAVSIAEGVHDFVGDGGD